MFNPMSWSFTAFEDSHFNEEEYQQAMAYYTNQIEQAGNNMKELQRLEDKLFRIFNYHTQAGAEAPLFKLLGMIDKRKPA